MSAKVPTVYMIASARNGTLYIGVTSDLCSRVNQHKKGVISGFTKEYGVRTLVWFEYLDTMESAIRREKQIKKWKRAWKTALIEETNPLWLDRFAEVCGRYLEDRLP